MIDQFRTVYRGGTGEIVEKKSRFIATVRLVESEEEALSCLEALRKKYWDARHNCFVYIIGENQETVRCSDDGEPSGTAGRPMLDVVQGAGLRNVLVVVTRYFGGTLLGTGGLVRAYSQAVQEGLANSVLIDEICGVRLLIETDYNGIGKSSICSASGDSDSGIRVHRSGENPRSRSENGGGPSLRGDYRGDERKGKTGKRRGAVLCAERRRADLRGCADAV